MAMMKMVHMRPPLGLNSGLSGKIKRSNGNHPKLQFSGRTGLVIIVRDRHA